MAREEIRQRARQPTTVATFLVGSVVFVVGWLVLEWRYTFGIGLVLMVLSLMHILFGTYDRRTD